MAGRTEHRTQPGSKPSTLGATSHIRKNQIKFLQPTTRHIQTRL